jgi:hypothetical protein
MDQSDRVSRTEPSKAVVFVCTAKFEDLLPNFFILFQKAALEKIFPFVFLFEFEDVNWESVANETHHMGKLAKRLYNWTVVPERQVSLLNEIAR